MGDRRYQTGKGSLLNFVFTETTHVWSCKMRESVKARKNNCDLSQKSEKKNLVICEMESFPH